MQDAIKKLEDTFEEHISKLESTVLSAVSHITAVSSATATYPEPWQPSYNRGQIRTTSECQAQSEQLTQGRPAFYGEQKLNLSDTNKKLPFFSTCQQFQL